MAGGAEAAAGDDDAAGSGWTEPAGDRGALGSGCRPDAPGAGETAWERLPPPERVVGRVGSLISAGCLAELRSKDYT